MNIDKFKQQHIEIMQCLSALRSCVREGIEENARSIAMLIVSMSSTIKLHLAVEDTVLYPALQKGSNSELASMGKSFQAEMEKIASTYMEFARKWNTAANLGRDPEGFRSEANRVLKILHDRMQRENTVFYPAVEAL